MQNFIKNGFITLQVQQSKHSPSLMTTLNAFSKPLNSRQEDFVSPWTIPHNAQHLIVMHTLIFQFFCYLK